MNTKSIIAIGIVTILFSCLFSVLAWQYVMQRCLWWECAPARNFQIAELELPSSLFPPGAIVNHIYPLSDEVETVVETVEDGTQSIYWDDGNGNAGYTIYRYPSIREAIRGFKHLLVDSETKEAWERPINLTFANITADVAYIACSPWSHKNCAMVARYQEYVIFFDTILDQKMTYTEFEKIAIYIDQQMSNHLYP